MVTLLLSLFTSAAWAGDPAVIVPGEPRAARAPTRFAQIGTLAEAMEYLADHHGKTFHVQDMAAMKAKKVSIIAGAAEITPASEWEAFLSMLEVNGLEVEAVDDVVWVTESRG